MPVPYVAYGGSLMLKPPYRAQGVGFYAFLLEAKVEALQRLLDERLNGPSGGQVDFEPAGPFVMLAFTDMGKLSSLDEEDRNKGVFAEHECALWVRVVDRKQQRSFWFHPYIFVDNPYALALGREVYGFPKSWGWSTFPQSPEGAAALSMETVLLPEYGPQVEAVRRELIRAERTTQPNQPVRIVTDALSFGAELLGAIAGREGVLGKPRVIEESLNDLLHGTIPMVFLKQFAASDSPGTACYQAVVETEARASALHGLAILPGEWTVTITPAASHPMVAELGLPGNVIQSALQLWIGFDMVIELGHDACTAFPTGLPAREASAAFSSKAVTNVQPSAKEPKKIAILGGGVGAMTTALQVTNETDWKSKYDITVYQMGWRLGGKGASGRGENNRIEEHGLHIWLGFYENAFRMMRQVYVENQKNRPVGSPLREWSEAFLPHDFVAVTDGGPGLEWQIWPMHLPRVPGEPGEGNSETYWTTFVRILGWIHEVFQDSAFREHSSPSTTHHVLFAEVSETFIHLREFIADACTTGSLALALVLEAAWRLAKKLQPDPRTHSADERRLMTGVIETFRRLWQASADCFLKDADAATHRSFVLIDFGVSVVSGLLSEGYLENPEVLDSLEDEFQDWLRRQGASPLTYDINRSAIIRGLYDLVFAYKNGEDSRSSFEAGPALRSSLLILGAYKGSVFWKMQAGMGDVVFAPFYQVLRDRGVKFEFFNRVEQLELNADATSIAAIRIGVQATLKDPAAGYAPLREVKGLPCWPSAPCYEQLIEGDQIKEGNYNLESFWTNWQNPKTRVLQAGQDFDEVVLAISIGALPYLFKPETALPQGFRLMLENVQTVATQAIQLWVKPPLDELGWGQGDVVLDAYTSPINTWAVMDQLLVRESWTDQNVKGIHYFCGQMVGGIPDRTNLRAPEEALAALQATYNDFITQNLKPLWPRISPHDVSSAIVSKYLRTNIDPTERYVMSVAGSSRYRLRADQSGFSNVTLAGDWTNNGFNAGCVEAAAMSGIQAANVIAGRPVNAGIHGALARPFGLLEAV